METDAEANVKITNCDQFDDCSDDVANENCEMPPIKRKRIEEKKEKMNQKCSVCKEPAAGYHFGAFTCEGCKSFFGRTYSNPASVSECKNGGNCEINKKSRTSCKACRLKKCILAGMSKSSSRYGRRSNWFKINHLLKPQAEKEDKQNERPHTVPSIALYQSSILPQSYIPFNDEGNAASTNEKISENHVNDVANFHNNGLLSRNWHVQFQPQLPPITPLSTSNEVTSSPIDNQIQQQNPITMQHALSILSVIDRLSRKTSESDFSDEDRLLDVESKSNSSRVSPSFTLTNKMDEPTLFNSRVSINGSLMLMDAHNPYLNAFYSVPSMITPATYSARGGDSLLISPNPGGLADERDEPIDLSMRACGSSSQPNESLKKEEEEEEEEEEDQINDSDSSSTEENAANPLDLTLDATPLKLNL